MIKKIYVLYHGDWDGIVAAWVARQFITGDAEVVYQAVQHHYEPPDVPAGSDIYILDFAFKPEQFDEICKGQNKVVMLDHHKTAIDRFEPGTDFSKWWKYPPNAEVHFEDGVAGCMMAWKYFNVGYEGIGSASTSAERMSPTPPDLVAYAADHDLWKYEMPESKLVRGVIRSYSQSFESCDELDRKFKEDGIIGVAAEGVSLRRYMDKLVESAVRHAEWFVIAGHRCLGAQVPFDGLISEVAGELAGKDGAKFGLCWFKAKGNNWIYSLRSRDDFDVSKVALQFGGGGHVQAAGFNGDMNPVQFLEKQE